MFRDLIDYLGYKLKQLIQSRLFPLSILFVVMFGALLVHLFNLQIVEGESAQEEYTQTTRKEVSLSSTRGNIYDRNGNLLAYNKLVYVVTVTDNGDYSNGYEKNIMLLQLIEILDKHEETLTTKVPIVIDSKGNFQYTSEGNTLLRFLRDMYGLSSIDDFDEDNPSDITAKECFEYLKDRYGVGRYSGRDGDTYEVSDEDALKCINIRYGMAQNSYQKYVSTTVAEDISTETMQDILEHSTVLLGVDVEEDYVRVYNYAEAFSHVIGYIGKASTDEIESLNESGGSYTSGDVIGKTGIESYNELDLQGTKGERVMYVDSEGKVISIESEVEPVTGSDVYLTLDADLQLGIYNLIEQSLASIILDKLVSSDVTILPTMKASERLIGIKDVYFQLINNNILDMDAFGDEDASAAEKRIYSTFQSEQSAVLNRMESELTSSSPRNYIDLSDDMQAYMTYAYSALQSAGILTGDDSTDAYYIQYHTDETMSLQEFLRYALSQSWIDSSLLELSEKYTSAEDTYQALVKKTIELLSEDSDFSKKIYEQLIEDGDIGGCDLCLALFSQGVLEEDASAIAELESGSASTAYQFIRKKISNLELTPAMLALDPCSAAVTVIDPDTGEVLAMVSYPGYDNNRISDSSYYYKLSQDESHPLYSAATQTRTAPGSTFKLVSTMIALEEGLVTTSSTINCVKTFTEVGLNLSCTGTHGKINIGTAIEKSCNFFFSEIGYEASLDSSGNYSETLGVSIIQKYSEMVGLSLKSGVEVTEMEPNVSDSAPIPSAIGQGTHSYTNIQLARYATVLATQGNVYNLTILDHVADVTGKTIAEYSSEVIQTVDISTNTWDVIADGMRRVITKQHSDDFNSALNMAGKTGTAEENKMRPNHAVFIGYAPYDDPEYSIAVTIPNGFSSTYACKLANSCMELVMGETTLEDVLGDSAAAYNGTISDD